MAFVPPTKLFITLTLLAAVWVWAAAAAGGSVTPCSAQGQPYTACAASWKHKGPGTYVGFPGTDQANAGAIQVVAKGPGSDVMVGSVNGGIWKTTDIYAKRPAWEPVLDGQPISCGSISALAYAPANNSIVYGGCGGSTSSEMGTDWNVLNNGDWGGVMISTDAGKSWSMTKFPTNFYVTGIVPVGQSTVIVSARSNFFSANDGGIWVTKDKGNSWVRTFQRPVFFLERDSQTGTVYAAVPFSRDDSVWQSKDDGGSWENYSTGLDWSGGRQPFYPCLAISTANKPAVLFVGALTVNPNNPTDTLSDIFWRKLGSDKWTRLSGGPHKLDGDGMPKDRMALLADPAETDTLYVAGNGGNFVYRVNWKENKWTDMWKSDTTNGVAPHADCRNYAWESERDSLLLVTDGGIWMRKKPRGPGGVWIGVNGDIAEMEFYTAAWDGRLNRWIGGAQDNCVQIAASNVGPRSVSHCRVFGDGTLTAADNRHNPSRMYGCTQFLGGLSFFEGDYPGWKKVVLPIDTEWFKDPRNLPFFAHPFALNSQDPNRLVFWANGTEASRPSGFYEAYIPDNATSSKDIQGPKLLLKTPPPTSIYTLVAGGYTNGLSDPNVLVGMNGTHLLHKSSTLNGKLFVHKLPQRFAEPIILNQYKGGQAVLGPLSHWKTVSLAVSPADSQTVAVTGWPETLLVNADGSEGVWLSSNGGKNWIQITGNLIEASGTVARARPAGILFVPIPGVSTAILIGTVTGVFVSWTDVAHRGLWSRLGLCSDFPLVVVPTISYEHYSDTIVVGSLGRGVYTLHAATQELLKSREQQDKSTCVVPPYIPRENNTLAAAYFPPQEE
eukprot:TRINITY_DN63786_c0_g1_i1.p1 TRINITY_DN63786_c0_g1~~TRINITY_DN63786_c0_g1_i1.p1  ORF type:complete len:836 (-),score=92.73 TRINITY_DN63786_c0_g1_i1:30-2537(-)